jgi:hypothetical protein
MACMDTRSGRVDWGVLGAKLTTHLGQTQVLWLRYSDAASNELAVIVLLETARDEADLVFFPREVVDTVPKL